MQNPDAYKLKCRVCGDVGEMYSLEIPACIPDGMEVAHIETVCETCPNDGKGEIAVATQHS